jgi:hypothetical protein
MYDYVLVNENNALIDRTRNYACEKKWYSFKTLRPQKAATKAYNSICYHNANFKKDESNFIFLECSDQDEKQLNEVIKPICEFDYTLKKEFIEKIKKLEKITKPLFIYVRKLQTNKMYGYFITSKLNLNPNLHELKNKIIIKTKTHRIEGNDQNGLKPNDYKDFL